MNAYSDRSDVFKTPSPSRRKKGGRNLFSDRCSEAHTPSNAANLGGEHLTPTTTPRRLSLKMRARSHTDPLPKKFKQEMPMSARKAKPAPVPPSARDFLPIQHSSFYGTKGNSPSVSSSNLSSPSTSVYKSSPNIEIKLANEARPALGILPSQGYDALCSRNKETRIKKTKSGK